MTWVKPSNCLSAQISGIANGFPAYRLGAGAVRGFQQRTTECLVSFLFDPFEPGSEPQDLFELYAKARGDGLPIETPAVRSQSAACQAPKMTAAVRRVAF
jgi:hypothetical protein